MRRNRLFPRLLAIGLTISAPVDASEQDVESQNTSEDQSADAAQQPPNYREEVLKIVQANFAKLRECFAEAADRRDASIPEKLSTIFVIGRHGNVQSVSFEEEAMMTAELERCVVARISYFKFPSRELSEGKSASSKVRLVLNFKKPE